MTRALEKLTVARALELLDQAVAERGADFVYPEDWKVVVPRDGAKDTPMCVYVHDGQPRCIVGQVLVKHGLKPAKLAFYEGHGVTSVLKALGDSGVLSFEHGVLTLLRTAQDLQDDGCSWGGAVAKAREALYDLRSELNPNETEVDRG